MHCDNSQCVILKNILNHFVGLELCIDEVSAYQYLLDYNKRIELSKVESSLDVFKELKNASGTLQILSGSGEQKVTNFSKLNFDLPSGSIISLDLNGFMSSEDGLCSYGAKSFANTLLAYKNVSNVIGAKINIDSGGGEAMAGHIIHNAIKEFGKPVVSFVYNAGSAAYLAASASKYIVAANQNSRIGSIGAMMSISKKFLEKYGEDIIDIYPASSPDKNKEFNSLLQGDDGPMKEMLTKSVDIFHKIVKQNRPLNKDIEGTLKGGMFFAEDAKRRGLIDFIGSNEFALTKIKK